MKHALDIFRLLTDRRIIAPALEVYRDGRAVGRVRDSSGHYSAGSIREVLRAVEFLRRWLRRERLVRHGDQWVVNSFLAPFPGAAFDRTFRNMMGSPLPVPLSAYVAVTADCSANCWYCSARQYRNRPRPTHAECMDTLQQVLDLGASLIGLTGGEPLLRRDLPELVSSASRRGAAVQLFTSGLGLSRQMIEALRDAQLWAMGVGLDRADPEATERLCQVRGAFDAATNALRMSRQAGFYTLINAVMDAEAVESGEHHRLYRLAQRLGVHEVRLFEPMPCGALLGYTGSRLLKPHHIAELRRFHRQTNRRGGTPKVCTMSEVESPELFGCIGGTLHLYIDASGEVCPCDFTPLSFGNVREEPLADIWQRMTRAMGRPRRQCFLQENARRIEQASQGGQTPLQPEKSCQLAAACPAGSLPDYFETVTTPFGYPSQATARDGALT